jgi:hypothetical protein
VLITLDSVRVGRGAGAALPPTSLSFGTGKPVAVAVETEQRPTVLSLVASGRMKVDAGTVTPDDLRSRVALIDTPLVAEPVAELRVRTIVAEEFAFAGRRDSVKKFLAERQLSDFGNATMSSLPPIARLRLLVDLALLRPGIDALIFTSPERHGGHPAEWWRVARETAARGLAVLVITDQAGVDAIAGLPGRNDDGKDDDGQADDGQADGPDAVPHFESSRT